MKADCKTDYRRKNGPIHDNFGLSYCAYAVIPRLALQSMPIWWQKLFLWLASMLPDTPEYICQRRDAKGKFIKNDPWANYRHGRIEDLLSGETETVKQWKILSIEEDRNDQHNHR